MKQIGKDATHFGTWLRYWRDQARLTQDELATKAGITKSYVSKLELQGPHTESGSLPRPDLEIVDKLATALNRPHWEARIAAGYGAEYPPEIEEAIGLLLSADPHNREELIELLKFVASQRKVTKVEDLPTDYDETKHLKPLGKRREG